MVRNMNKEDWDKDDKMNKEMDMHRIADKCNFAADDNQCNQLEDCMVMRKGSGGGRPRGSGERPRGSGERPRGSGENRGSGEKPGPRGSGGRRGLLDDERRGRGS